MKSDLDLCTSSPLPDRPIRPPGSALSRRAFLKQTPATAAGMVLYGCWGEAHALSPNEKLNIGPVGVAGRAGEDLHEVSSQNIVAICDIDDNNLAGANCREADRYLQHHYRKGWSL